MTCLHAVFCKYFFPKICHLFSNYKQLVLGAYTAIIMWLALNSMLLQQKLFRTPLFCHFCTWYLDPSIFTFVPVITSITDISNICNLDFAVSFIL